MKRYCLVYELKEENVKDYVDIHKEAHKTHWRTQLDALKEAGARNCIVYNYKSLSIIFYECEDIDESFTKLGANEANLRWQETVAPWFAEIPKFDGSQKVQPVEKIFDLNQQLEGKLEQF